jgi:hypothetical protein
MQLNASNTLPFPFHSQTQSSLPIDLDPVEAALNLQIHPVSLLPANDDT